MNTVLWYASDAEATCKRWHFPGSDGDARNEGSVVPICVPCRARNAPCSGEERPNFGVHDELFSVYDEKRHNAQLLHGKRREFLFAEPNPTSVAFITVIQDFGRPPAAKYVIVA